MPVVDPAQIGVQGGRPRQHGAGRLGCAQKPFDALQLKLSPHGASARDPPAPVQGAPGGKRLLDRTRLTGHERTLAMVDVLLQR